MKYVNESLRKEVERMLFLSENSIPTKPVGKAPAKDDNKSVIKEDDDFGSSIFGDVDIQLSKAAKNDKLGTGGEKAELSTPMKMAMVLNRIQANDAKFLGAFTGWKPRTKHVTHDIGTGKATVSAIGSVEKLSGGRGELKGMQTGFTAVTLPDLDPNMSDAEKKETAKWLSHAKNRFIISYAGGKLTPTGKAQIEFLARVLAGNPLDYSDEARLLKSKYAGAAKHNAQGILYDFYSHAMIPIMVTLGKRAKYTPYDVQLDILMTDGLMHAFEQTVNGKYDPSMGNYGAWLMRTVKNKAIDHLRKITDFTLDERHVYEMLSAMPGPFIAISSLDPAEAHGNFVDAKPNREHPGHWDYIYRDPMDALSDFQAGAQRGEDGIKKSPLQARFLLNPELFYKGHAKDLTGADIDTEQSYEIDTETVIPVQKVPAEAKKEIYAILDDIASHMLTNYKEYGIKNISGSVRANKEFVKDLMFSLLGYGGMVPVYATSFVARNGSVFPAGTPARFTEAGELEKDSKGVVPEVKYIWTVRRDFKGDEGMKTDFTNTFKEKALEKYGEVGLPQHFTANPKDFVNKIYGALRYYFGFRGEDKPLVRDNKNKLDQILLNYSEALLAESRQLKKLIREVLLSAEGKSDLDKYKNVLVIIDGVFMGDPSAMVKDRIFKKFGNEDMNVYIKSTFGQDLFKKRGRNLLNSTMEEWRHFHDKKYQHNFDTTFTISI